MYLPQNLLNNMRTFGGMNPYNIKYKVKTHFREDIANSFRITDRNVIFHLPSPQNEIYVVLTGHHCSC